MNIVIYGVGNYGRYFYEKIISKENSRINVVGFIDGNKTEAFDNLPVWTLDKFFQSDISDINGILIAVNSLLLKNEFVISLLKRNYKQIYLVDNEAYDCKLDVLDEKGDFSRFVYKYDSKKPVLPYIQYNVLDCCNLNCNGCCTFAHLYKNETTCDVDKFDIALNKLKEKFRNITRFRLLGGEPLMAKELPYLIKRVREEFPLTELHITTNGLLIPKMSKELIKAMNDYSAIFSISVYPPTQKILDDIVKTCIDNQIKFALSSMIGIGDERDYWSKFININGNTDINESFFNDCISCFTLGRSNTLRNGRIYPCPLGAMLYEKRVQDFLEIYITEEEDNNSSSDLMDDNIDGWDIISKLNLPTSFCRFCTKKISTQWSNVGDHKKEDYFADCDMK